MKEGSGEVKTSLYKGKKIFSPGGYPLCRRKHLASPARVRPDPNPQNHNINMPTFSTKKFVPSGSDRGLGAVYRRYLSKHPFLLFGLPFIGTIVAGSFFLTPATALRYEKHDRKVKRLSQEEAMGLGKDRRRIDLNEEYYVSSTELAQRGYQHTNCFDRDWLLRT
jgi:cytochrome c oxidase assembly protein subunit 16